MKQIDLKDLLEAGCHFGHQVTRQNPKAREFIFQEREGIHVIDLAKTKEGLEQAGAYVQSVALRNGKILFLGTKRQAKTILLDAIKRSPDIFFIVEHWTGGTLTNFEEVGKNYKKLTDLKARVVSEEEKAKYTKKEIGLWQKEIVKLEKLYGGVVNMTAIPDVLFIVDTHKEDLAVKEAIRRGVKVVGIVDTNADPSIIDYPIPANDDAVGSIQYIVDYITDAWVEGRKSLGKAQEKEIKDKEKEAVKVAEKKVKEEAKAAKKASKEKK